MLIWKCFAAIIATAIPKITDEFPGSIQDVGWYGSAYLLTVSPGLIRPPQ